MTGAPWTPEPGAIVFLPEITEGMTDEEAYAFLSRDRPEAVFPAEPNEVIVAGLEPHNGAMVALIPSFEDLERLEVEGGEPLGELHITMFFLGEAADIDDQTRADIVATLEELLLEEDLIPAVVFGLGVFNPTGDEPAVILNVGGEGLERIKNVIEEGLIDADVAYPNQHVPWVPHITLGYDKISLLDAGEAAPQRMGPITIDRVRVAFGGEVTDLPLGVGVTAAAVHTFHLPGKHDQSEHGKGKKPGAAPAPKKAPKKAPSGGTGHASPAEVAAAKKLNDGEKLDSSVPEEKQLKRAIQDWSAGEENLVQLRGEMKDATMNPSATTNGATLMRTIAASPQDSPTLYRGMFDVNPADIPDQGGTIKMGPSS